MHELSIVMNVIAIAEEQATNAGGSSIEEIDLDIGKLSSVETEAFDFAWQQAVKGTMLQSAKKVINNIDGEAQCKSCERTFKLEQLYDACTFCGSYSYDVIHGKELQVKRIIINVN